MRFFLSGSQPARRLTALGFSVVALATLTADASAQKRPKRPEPTPEKVAPIVLLPGARILFGTAPLPSPNPSRAPYKDPDDGAICVAPEALKVLGIAHSIDSAKGRVTLTNPDGRGVTIVAARPAPAGRGGKGVFIDLKNAIETLGGVCEIDGDTAVLRATLLSIALDFDKLDIRATLPIVPKVSSENDGKRVRVEFPAAVLGDLPGQLDLKSDLVESARIEQSDDNTTVLTLELSRPESFRWTANRPGTQVSLGPASAVAPPATVAVVRSTTPAPAKLPGGPMAKLMAFGFSSVDNETARLTVRADRVPNFRPSVSGDRMTLDFGNIRLAEAAASSLADISHPLVRSLRVVSMGEKAARLVIDTTRAVAFALKVNPKSNLLTVDITPPRKTDGLLAGKTIVIDPGHGGSSSGARGLDGVLEKNKTLPIAMFLAEELRNQGANVVLTRDCDADPGLSERAFIANRCEADVFISIHANDGVSNRSINGSEIYYHRQSASCVDLAKFIASQMGQIGDIRSRGALSDLRNAPGSGYAVLRNSQMTGVLVETGYLSNPGDCAALGRASTQKKIAVAVAQGIIDFYAANPSLDTHVVKPQRALPDSGLPDSEQ